MVTWLIKAEKFIAEDMHVWPKKMLRRCYVLADVIIFVYEVPCIFWHYVHVDEASWITLKKLLQSAMKLLQTATAFLLQGATQFITNCDRYYKVRWICYKLRQYTGHLPTPSFWHARGFLSEYNSTEDFTGETSRLAHLSRTRKNWRGL